MDREPTEYSIKQSMVLDEMTSIIAHTVHLVLMQIEPAYRDADDALQLAKRTDILGTMICRSVDMQLNADIPEEKLRDIFSELPKAIEANIENVIRSRREMGTLGTMQ